MVANTANRLTLPVAPASGAHYALARDASAHPQAVLFLALHLFRLAVSAGLVCYVFVSLSGWFWGNEAALSGPLRWLGVWGLFSVLYWGRSCVLYVLSFRERHWYRDDPLPVVAGWPLVSILVPAYNEAECIETALASLLELDYPAYEVLLIDDGSTDATLELARRWETTAGDRTLRVLHKPNGGKWTALNLGFQQARGELVLCVDADSRLDPQALRWLVARMADPRVGAVAGTVRVRNATNVLTRCQALEYCQSNDLLRTPMSRYGTVLVVAGPLGLFRRALLEEVHLRWGRLAGPQPPGRCEGPFEGDTFAEDFDLSLAILALGGRIVYEPRAISHTKAPATLPALLNQRYRWSRGNIQVLRKYFRRALADPVLRQPRLLGWLLATYVPDMSLWLPTATINFALLFMLLSGFGAGSSLLLIYWICCLLLNLCSAAICLLKLQEPDLTRLLLTVPLQEPYFGIVINAALAISVLDEVRAAPMRW